MREFTIDNVTITGDDYYLIAEIGNNHQGKADLCCTMIERAMKAGANAVKLQKRNIETFWSAEQLNAPYIKPDSFGATYREHKEVLEFNREEWEKVIIFAKKKGITLFSTVFDEESIDFLERYDLPAYKVASGTHNDYLLLERLVKTGKPLIISVAGGGWPDCDKLYNWLLNKGANFALLHCVAEYPAPTEHINLRLFPEMLKRYPGCVIGYSDHWIAEGYKALMSVGAYVFGARIFERHVTINRAWPGPDHKLSIEFGELEDMRHSLDRLKAAMGDGFKQFYAEEIPNIAKMKKWRG
jgi:sialic acid synthase